MLTEKRHILFVEDEPFLAKVVMDSLEQQGYLVTHATDGKKAYNLFQSHTFSLCIVDVMLPETDGFTLVKQIRGYNTEIPVLFLTARSATSDVVEGYKSGGNDYLKKPFGLEELFVRVQELLKRMAPKDSWEDHFTIGRYSFFPDKQILYLQDQKEIRLSHRETTLLLMLYKHRNEVLQRKETLMTLWGDDSFYNTRTMDVFITKLRKHLKQDPEIEILNIRGAGYKLVCSS